MTQHTPEPWKINHDDSTEEWSIVTNQHGSIVANVNEETGPELAGSIPVMRKMPGMENARRIVACVNACQGMEDPAALIAGLRSELQLATHKLLTCGVAARHPDASLSRRESDYGGKWNSPQAESVRQLRQQRDELLEALEEAKSVLASINSGNQHKVEVEDDEPAYWQRNEWVAWAKGEVLPMVEAVITKAKGAAAITKITGETK